MTTPLSTPVPGPLRRRRPAVHHLLLLDAMAAAAGLLAGCTQGADPARSPGSSSGTASAHPNPTAADDDESQDRWAHLKELVTARYPDAQYSAVGSSAQPTSFHLSPPTASGTTGLAVAVSCTGGGAWRVRIEQEHPAVVRGTCDGRDAEVPDAIPLDAHPTGVQLRVSPPRGVRFWMVAFYAR